MHTRDVMFMYYIEHLDVTKKRACESVCFFVLNRKWSLDLQISETRKMVEVVKILK